MNRNNFIAIYDNTPSAKFLYFSESFTDCCGWEPNELIGKSSYMYFHPEDHSALKRFHYANVANQKMSSMISHRFLHKNGSWVPIDTLVSYCYDILVTTTFVLGPESMDHRMRVNSVDEFFICKPDGSLQLSGAWNDKEERMKLTMEDGENWSNIVNNHKPEKRFCLILNRFTDGLNIAFASSVIEELTGTPTSDAFGKSIFEFIRERDISAFITQIDLTIENNLVIRIRFDWIINQQQELYQPLEAIASCTDDGVVLVIRQTPNFDLDQQQE
ncbi:hypothetical protein RMATCC62417_09806 [Rhizopus microsporus]|nr:hypothetical protein RMATCC62417_09806 [Rhizopus microsporus]